MKKLLPLLLLLILPTLNYGQGLWNPEENYFSIEVEADVANALDIGSRPNGFDGVLSLNYRNAGGQFGLSYETFPNLHFSSIGMGGSYILNHENRWNYLIGLELGLIWRDIEELHGGLHSSASINLQIEYHVDKTIFLFVRNETRYRGDLKARYDEPTPFVNSGFAGIGIKIN